MKIIQHIAEDMPHNFHFIADSFLKILSRKRALKPSLIMQTQTQTRIQKLEKEVAALWHVLEDERVWHTSVIYELKKRSKAARQALAKKKLRTARDVFDGFQI